MIKTSYNTTKFYNQELPKVIKNQKFLISRIRKHRRKYTEDYNHYMEIDFPSMRAEKKELIRHIQDVLKWLKSFEQSFSRGLSALLEIERDKEGDIIYLHTNDLRCMWVDETYAYNDGKFLDVVIRHGLKVPIYEI